jgi:hypothetical protein
MGYREITGVDLKTFIKEVYALSCPVGLGMLHYKPGPLSDEDVNEWVASAMAHNGGSDVVVDMDYVLGRCCKMVVWRRKDRLFIRDDWYDHSPDELAQLLNRVGRADAPKVNSI